MIQVLPFTFSVQCYQLFPCLKHWVYSGNGHFQTLSRESSPLCVALGFLSQFVHSLLVTCRPSLPVLLPATSGQGLQISGQLIRRDGHVFYSLKFDNLSQTFLDGFMIQFNKNTFGLAAAGPLQVGTHVFVCFSQFLGL